MTPTGHFHQKVDQWKLWRLGRPGTSPALWLDQPLHHPQPHSNPIPDSLFPWQQVLGWGIKNASLFLIQKRTHFAHRSLPYLVCPVWVSPADLIGDGPPSTSRWQNSYPSEFHYLKVHPNVFHCPLNSSPSTHNPKKREGFGIHITRICKSVKRSRVHPSLSSLFWWSLGLLSSPSPT